jgi:hypothetical protein
VFLTWRRLVILALGSLVFGYVMQTWEAAPHSAWGDADSAYEATLAAHRDISALSQGAALASIVAAATPGDLDGITRAYEEIHSGSGPSRMAMELLGEAWARYDPAAGLARASGWDRYWYGQFVPKLMGAWARLDGPAARDAAIALEEEELRQASERAGAIGRFDVGGPGAWDDYVADWPYGSGALQEVLERVVRRDGLEDLIRRVESLPESAPADLSARAFRDVAALGGRIDSIRTALFVEKHAESAQANRDNLLAPFVGAWGEREPEAALDWVVTQPQSQARNAATRVAFRPWVLGPKTRGEAIAWIEEQPEEVLMSVIDFYARALASIDPDRAIEAAERIERPARRARILALVKRRARGYERAAERTRARSIEARSERDGTIDVEPAPALDPLTADGAAEAR